MCLKTKGQLYAGYWDTYVHLHGISPLKLEFLVSVQTSPSAAMHHTLAMLFFVHPMGCCVFRSMWSMSGSGHRYWPTRNWLQSTSTAIISYNAFTKINKTIAKLCFIVFLCYPVLCESISFCKNTFLFELIVPHFPSHSIEWRKMSLEPAMLFNSWAVFVNFPLFTLVSIVFTLCVDKSRTSFIFDGWKCFQQVDNFTRYNTQWMVARTESNRR